MRVLYSDISESPERPTRETTDEGVSSYESNSCPSGPICEVTNMPDVPCTWSLPIPTEWIQICRSEPACKAKNILINGLRGAPGDARINILIYWFKILTEFKINIESIYCNILQYLLHKSTPNIGNILVQKIPPNIDDSIINISALLGSAYSRKEC